MFLNRKFILASKSKSRLGILKKNKLNFIQKTPKCDEEFKKKELLRKKTSPKNTSRMLAKIKAKSIGEIYTNILVIGADTTIEHNKKTINKAKNFLEARKKLKKISGKKINLYSSATAYYKNKQVWQATQKTIITMRKLSTKEINQYLNQSNKNLLMSVGCFQIEKNGPNIIEDIRGDFFNVMGFPLFPFLKFLKRFSIQK